MKYFLTLITLLAFVVSIVSYESISVAQCVGGTCKVPQKKVKAPGFFARLFKR